MGTSSYRLRIDHRQAATKAASKTAETKCPEESVFAKMADDSPSSVNENPWGL